MGTDCIVNIPSEIVHEITWKKLFNADYTLAMPFQLTLNGDTAPLYCEEIIRIIPGKRLVAFGTWADKPVAIKLFYEKRKAARHLEREVLGVEALLASGTPVPELLYYGSVQKKRIQVMVSARIEEAQNLDELWQTKSSVAELAPLMHAVTVELATQHVSGILQRDLHLKNLLIKGDTIYTLDGGSIQYFDTLLEKKPSLDNLALFFTQLGVGTEDLQQELFRTYALSRGWLLKKADVEFLRGAIKKWSRLRWQRYAKKITRRCSAFSRIVSPTALIMHDREYQSTEFQEFLRHPDTIFDQHDTEVLKSGRSATVAQITLNNKILILKRYNIKNFWHWLRRCLRATRAAKSWQMSHLLRMSGIPTAKPIAFIEKRFLGLRGSSWFLMERLSGKNLGEYFVDYCKEDIHFEKVAERVVVLFKNLARLRLSHGDLKITNILIEQGHPFLLDLDGMSLHSSQSEANAAFKKEMKRFMKNWETRADVAALFEKFLKG